MDKNELIQALQDLRELKSPLDNVGLRNYGLGLIYGATGHSYLVEKDHTFTGNNGVADKIALLPGVSQMGIPVSTKDMMSSGYDRTSGDLRLNDARNVDYHGDERIDVQAFRMGMGQGFMVDDDGSWMSVGQTFNMIQTADSTTFGIMATILVIAFNAFFQLIFALWAGMNKPKIDFRKSFKNRIQAKSVKSAFRNYKEDKSIPPGSKDPLDPSSLADSLNPMNIPVIRTLFANAFYISKNKYEDCLERGSAIMFGDYIDPADAGKGPLEFAKSLVRVFETPVVFFSMIRIIIMDLANVANEFAKLKDVAGFFNALDEMIKALKILFNSKFVKMMNILAGLGDSAIEHEKFKLYTDDSGLGGYPDETRYLFDEAESALLQNNPFARVGTLREANDELVKGKQVATYRTDSVPSMFLMPEYIKQSMGTTSLITEFEKRIKSPIANANGELARLSYEEVVELENQLECEYLPFYFHDLRTNEVIGFHAFLEDDITIANAVSYASIPGIGRDDPVRKYTGTEKSFSLAFNVIATNEEDLPRMHWKLSKLDSMCWPMKSAGTLISNGENSFVQPFSQIKTHSPLIRIRVGNLIRSNFSKLGLMNLFGIRPNSGYKLKLDDKEVTENDFKQAKLEVGAKIYLLNDPVTTYTITAIDEIPESLTLTIENDITNEITIVDSSKIILANNNDHLGSENIDAFLDPKTNVISKSFKSSGGRGLAGYITNLSISFRRDEWDTRTGIKIPRAAKVTLNFAPIHDLPPGLASDGFMYAPAYATGQQLDTIYQSKFLDEKKTTKEAIESAKFNNADNNTSKFQEALFKLRYGEK